MVAQGEELFPCKFCRSLWPSVRSRANHAVVHDRDRRRMQEALNAVGPPALALTLAPPGTMPRPHFFVAPPVTAPAQPVVPRFVYGRLPQQPGVGNRRTMVVRLAPPPVQPQAPPPPVPVAGNRRNDPIVMVPLAPNPDFWALYRMGLANRPVELDFLGQRPEPPPAAPPSPSPSFSGWLQDRTVGSSVDMEME
ncbi:hypothetical protein BS78_04G254700 [Paspalum vaginatum]|nr:hypothetical protein BS78_04G254700 [Paspalum vaginatum]